MKLITNEDEGESEDNLNSHCAKLNSPSVKQVILIGNNDFMLLLHNTIIQNNVQDDDDDTAGGL